MKFYVVEKRVNDLLKSEIRKKETIEMLKRKGNSKIEKSLPSYIIYLAPKIQSVPIQHLVLPHTRIRAITTPNIRSKD